MAGKEAVAVIIDVSKSMEEVLGAGNQSKLQTALQATKLLLQQKLIFGKSHEVALVLMGSDSSENDLHEANGGYDHISIVHDLDVVTLDSLRQLDTIRASRSRADTLDAIVVAVHMIGEHCGTKKYNKRVFLITDGNGTCTSVEQIPQIQDEINRQNIKVNVIAIGFHEVDPTVKLELTKNQQMTRKMLLQLLGGIQGAMFPSTQAMAIYKQFRKKAIYPVARFKGPLEFGPNYSIEVCMYSKTKEERMPSLKKFSSAVPFSADAKEGLVKMSRECALEDDPSNTIVDPDDIIKAYYYGTSIVPVSTEEEELLKYSTAKCIKLLGFVSRTDVRREWFMEGVELLLPAVTDSDQKAFKAIAQAMFNRNELALVRYVWRDNQPPRLGVLSPHIKKNLVCMYLNYLPCAEDIREYSFAPLAESTAEQQAAADDLVEALSLEFMEDGERIEALKPSQTFNPALQYLYQCLTHRMDEPEGPLPPLDPNIEEYLKPDEELFTRARAKCERFASKFVLKEVVQPKTQKKFYSEALKDEEAAAANKAKDAGSGEPTVEHISELTPEADFLRFLKDRTQDRVSVAIAEMQEMILRLVERAFRGNTHDKALSCLRSLRQGCLDEDETGQYNAFMQMQVKPLQQTQPEFWNKLVDSGITLISRLESDTAMPEPEEAARFLVKAESKPASQKPPDDDLMADIE